MDETAAILAEYGTPEKRAQYAAWGADRVKRDAYAAAKAEYDTAGQTAEALRVFTAAYEVAHAAWCAEYARIFAGMAAELGGKHDDSPAYNRGWTRGADLIDKPFDRPRDVSEAEWPAYVTGWAYGAQWHANLTGQHARQARAAAESLVA